MKEYVYYLIVKLIAWKDGHKVWKESGNLNSSCTYKLRINNDVNPFYKGLLHTNILSEIHTLLKDIRGCQCKACKKSKIRGKAL